jgi:hypothetical protein
MADTTQCDLSTLKQHPVRLVVGPNKDCYSLSTPATAGPQIWVDIGLPVTAEGGKRLTCTTGAEHGRCHSKQRHV